MRMQKTWAWIAFGLAFVLAACTTTPVERQQGTVESFADAQKRMQDTRAQLDRTMSALNQMLQAPPGELRAAVTQYGNNVEQLSSLSQALEKDASEMRERRADYLTEWERSRQDVASPELRQVAAERRKEVDARLTRIDAAYRGASQSFEPLLTQLQDIRRVAANDPTPAGIDALSQTGVVQSARERAASVSDRLALASNEVDQMRAQLAPTPGQATTAGKGAAGAPSFTLADRDASGAIEREEAAGIAGLDFQSADRDRDGRLSQSEYEAAASGSTRPSTDGGVR